MSSEFGLLYLAATPIGNLKDITLRVLEILGSVDLILAEDTRRTGLLLKTYDIHKPLLSYHDHNKVRKTPDIIKRLVQGENIALVTDAGTPGISDPGYYLVRAAIGAGITVTPLPGASACIAALSCSGLPSDRFLFYGFIPRKPGKRRSLLEEALLFNGTIILYESPFRVIKTLGEVIEIFGSDREVVVAREISKIYEEFLRGRAAEVLEEIRRRNSVKGECVILISGKAPARDEDVDE